MGVWRRRLSAHELSRWRLRTPTAHTDGHEDSQAPANAYELLLLLDEADLFGGRRASARRLASPAYELLVLQYTLY